MPIFSRSTGSRSKPGSKQPDDLAGDGHIRRRSAYLLLTAGAVVVMALTDGGETATRLASAVALALIFASLAFSDRVPALPLAAGAASAAIASAIAFTALLSGDESHLLFWPEVLVAGFAGFALEADRAVRFQKSWQDPRAANGPASLLSVFGGLSLGAALCILFYAVLGTFGDATPANSAGGFILASLKGTTTVHRLLIWLFFTTLALELFLALSLLRESQALAALRRDINQPDIVTPETAALARYADSRAAAIARAGLGMSGPEPVESHRALSQEARRFLRALISFMPILGFIGTVIGLATAIAALENVGSSEGGAEAVAASLSGLAVKFETTLLGLGGALIASLLLSLIERRETEYQIDATRLFARGAQDVARP